MKLPCEEHLQEMLCLIAGFTWALTSESILPVNLNQKSWGRAKHLGTPPQLGWQRAWPGQVPGDSFTSAPSAAFLGCHQSQPHSHSSQLSPSSAQAYTTRIKCFCKWTQTAKWHFSARPAARPHFLHWYWCPKNQQHQAAAPDAQQCSHLSCHTHIFWNLLANFLPFHWMEIKITMLIWKYMTYIGMELLIVLPNKFPVSLTSHAVSFWGRIKGVNLWARWPCQSRRWSSTYIFLNNVMYRDFFKSISDPLRLRIPQDSLKSCWAEQSLTFLFFFAMFHREAR